MKITIPNWIIDLKDKILDNDNNLKKDNKVLLKKVKKVINKTYKSSNVVHGISGLIMSIVGIAVTLAVGLVVLSQLQKTMAVDSVGAITGVAYNATAPESMAIRNTLGALPNFMGIIITVTVAFIVLGYFYQR